MMFVSCSTLSRIWLVIWLLSLGIGSAYAGGGPQNALVVVNENSTNSVFLGKEYARQRGIPERNILRIATVTTNNIELAQFTNEIRNPVEAYLVDTGLDNQVDYLIFAYDIPFRIYEGAFTDYRHASLTSAMFDQFYASPDAFVSGCNLAAGSVNDYAGTDLSFARPDLPVQPHYRMAALLTSRNKAYTLEMIDRATAVDFTVPEATVYFEHGEDVRRNGRWVQYEDAAFTMLLRTNRAVDPAFPDGFGDPSPRTNVMGLMTGLRVYPRFTNTTFMSGSFAEHLTSFGGFLWNVNEGRGITDPWQMSILSWVIRGVGASYGTVVEPCAYPDKFPAAWLHDRYTRGFSMGESLYLSVNNPYQGLFVGDPLMQPYAIPPEVTLGGVTAMQVVSGTVSLVVTASYASVNGRVNRLDLYVNDQFRETFARANPLDGNQVSVTVAGTTRTYTIGSSESLQDVAAGVAGRINANPPLPVRAFATGDRVVIQQKATGQSATGLSYSVTTSQNTATALTVHAVAGWTNLLESPFSALDEVEVNGSLQPGDVLRLVVTRLDSVVVTSEVSAVSGDNRYTMLLKLMDSVNTNAMLQGSTGVRMGKYSTDPYSITGATAAVISRTNGWQSYGPSIVLTEISANMSVSGGGLLNLNTNTLNARGMIEFKAGMNPLVAEIDIDTTELPDGPAILRWVGFSGDGPGTQGQLVLPVDVRNHDLTCTITNLSTVHQVMEGSAVGIQGRTDFSSGILTGVLLFVEGKPFGWTNTAEFSFTVNSGALGIGNAEVQAQAFLNNGQTTLSDSLQLQVRTASLFTSLTPTNGTITTVTNILPIAAVVSSGFPVTNVSVQSGPGLLVGSNLTFTGPGTVELVFHEAGDRFWSEVGSTSTITVLDVLSFSVASDFGTVSPPPGSYELVEGTVLTNTLSGPIITAGQTQWVALGWSLAGHEPGTGMATQFVMTVTNDASLIWLWSTNYWLETSPDSNGTIVPVTGWQPFGTSLIITASADPYYTFEVWTGALAGALNPEALLIDQPYVVGASFVANLTTNTLTPEWWLASFGLTNDFPSEALADQDGDKVPTWEEYIAGTIPTNGLSWLGFPQAEVTGSGMILQWRSESGRVYDLEGNVGLTNASWIPVPGATNLPGSPPTNAATVLGTPLNEMFRVKVRLAP
jgi:uncharacterized protein (TIGR03790 family)